MSVLSGYLAARLAPEGDASAATFEGGPKLALGGTRVTPAQQRAPRHRSVTFSRHHRAAWKHHIADSYSEVRQNRRAA